MKRILAALIVLITAANISLAQTPKIEFKEETYDFGQVEETGGPIEHKFVFTNKGKSPLIIQGVKASCGCTTPSWTKEPVLPGADGHITARYDPANRPGAFTKSLTVTSNADPNVTRVYIKGMVNPKPKTTQNQYPVKLGNLRMKYRSMHMGDVSTKEPVTKKFEIYNDSDAPLTFTEKVDAPSYVKVSFEPSTIAPQEEGKLVVTYDGKAKNDFGTVIDNISVYTNEETDSKKDFRVQATIKEYFPPMTAEELAKAPKLHIESTTYDFGTIKTGQKVDTEYTLVNTGKSTLNIRAAKTTCGCTIAELSKENLAPGESVQLKVIFDSTDRRGNQQKSINIFSNDPQKPAQRVILKGKVDA